MKARFGACVMIGTWWLISGPGIEAAEPSEACRLLASRFAAAPATVEAHGLVDLSGCVARELGARAGMTGPSGGRSQPAIPPAPPANVFPSPSVQSPPVSSPVIPTPEESGAAPTPAAPSGQTATAPPPALQSSGSAPTRYFGQWPPPAPWLRNWPEPGPWERP